MTNPELKELEQHFSNRLRLDSTDVKELRRVLKPSGRLVVGETYVGDPHMVRFSALRERAARAGLPFETRLGSPFGYFARR